MFVRMLKIVVIHMFFAALGVAAVWAMTRSQSALSPDAFGLSTPAAAIGRMLEQLRSNLMAACAAAVGWSAICGLVWTWISERADVAVYGQVRRYRAAWAGLALTALAGVGGAGWLVLWRTRMAALADPMTLWAGGAVTFVTVLIAYWLATAYAVRPPMIPAVTGARAVRRLTSGGR